jgi:colicin import membrane protein
MSQSSATLPADPTSAIRITAYEEIRVRVDELAKENALKVFNYEDRKEQTLARSHIHSLRKVKGDVERARVAAKADALAYGKRIDAVAKDLEKLVDDMIDVHAKPLAVIDEREEARKAKHEQAVSEIIRFREWSNGQASEAIAKSLAFLKKIDTSGMEEFIPQADSEILASIRHLESALTGALKREDEAAELARLRAEKAKRDQADREARIREEAAASERNKIEEANKRKAAADAAAKAKQEADAKAEKERIEREAREQVAAAERRELEAKLTAEREIKRVQDEARAKEDARIKEQEANAAAERRAAENKRRRTAVHLEICEDLAAAVEAGRKEGPLNLVNILDLSIAAIAAGKVRHLNIAYA